VARSRSYRGRRSVCYRSRSYRSRRSESSRSRCRSSRSESISTRSQILLEGRSSTDTLARILVNHGIRVTGIGHTTSSNLRVTSGRSSRSRRSVCSRRRNR
jgi:hypothetical protein